MVAKPVAAVQAALEWKLSPAEGVALSVTVVAVLRFAGLPNASCTSMVAEAEQAPAATVWGPVANARALGGPGLMVSVWPAVENPLAVPVMAGAPAAGLLK